VEAHARASNPQKDADDCLLQAGWLPLLKAFLNCCSTVSCDRISDSVSHASASYKVAALDLLGRVLRATLQRDPCVEGADQSRPYAIQA